LVECVSRDAKHAFSDVPSNASKIFINFIY